MRKYKVYNVFRGRPAKKLTDIQPGYAGLKIYLWCNGVYVGTGTLRRYGSNALSTGSVWLENKHRRKGHGIVLYQAFIRAARRLGAVKLYSDRTLNKFSRRMWIKKLAQFYNTHEVKLCKSACKHCSRKTRRFYIVLNKKS